MPNTTEGYLNELALFAGAGGGILGGHLLGWRTVCAVEWEPYPASVLVARQNDKILPPFPIWDDVQTFDGKPWRGIVDVVSGGFPCQDISAAGKGAGITGSKSSMWKHMARIVGEVRPRLVYVENSPLLIKRGAAVVISDLTSLGYDCQWCIVSAADCGAPHKRDRFWLLAYANVQHGQRRSQSQQPSGSGGETWDQSSGCGQELADTKSAGLERWQKRGNEKQRQSRLGKSSGPITAAWSIEPNVGRVANGVAARVDRLKALGNGQVPAVAATAFRILSCYKQQTCKPEVKDA